MTTLYHRLLQTHLFARVRDESGNPMGVCTRLECCAQNQCLAVFEGCGWDAHYGCRGASFLVFTGQKQIKLVSNRYTYSDHKPLSDGLDRFEVSSYVLCALLKGLYQASQPGNAEWWLVSADQEVVNWLAQPVPFDPVLLSFLVSPDAHRRVYS